MTVEHPITKYYSATNHNRRKQRDKPISFVAITCNLHKAREKSLVQRATGSGFGFVSHWLKNWRERTLKPITKRNNRLITSNNHLKTALYL